MNRKLTTSITNPHLLIHLRNQTTHFQEFNDNENYYKSVTRCTSYNLIILKKTTFVLYKKYMLNLARYNYNIGEVYHRISESKYSKLRSHTIKYRLYCQAVMEARAPNIIFKISNKFHCRWSACLVLFRFFLSLLVQD